MRGIFAKYKTKVGDGVYMVALDNIDPEYLEKYEAFNLKIAQKWVDQQQAYQEQEEEEKKQRQKKKQKQQQQIIEILDDKKIGKQDHPEFTKDIMLELQNVLNNKTMNKKQKQKQKQEQEKEQKQEKKQELVKEQFNEQKVIELDDDQKQEYEIVDISQQQEIDKLIERLKDINQNIMRQVLYQKSDERYQIQQLPKIKRGQYYQYKMEQYDDVPNSRTSFSQMYLYIIKLKKIMNSYDEEIDDKVKAYYKLQNLLAYMISLENPSIVKPDI